MESVRGGRAGGHSGKAELAGVKNSECGKVERCMKVCWTGTRTRALYPFLCQGKEGHPETTVCLILKDAAAEE